MRVAGIMSGTSLDGIDVAIVDISGKRVSTVAFSSTPYPDDLRARILAVSNVRCETRDISRLNFELGAAYADAVLTLCKSVKISRRTIELIGCHGQTVYHEGRSDLPNTLQVGEPAVIVERLGVPVVSNFRARDIGAGGQGAPLVPFVDDLLFASRKVNRVALNIGGIANITILGRGKVIAFDTGPGNMVIDQLVERHTNGAMRYDRDGRVARGAHVDRELLDSLLADSYFQAPPPKSAGREQYGREFVDQLIATGKPMQDLIATATAFTAASIALGIQRFAPKTEEIIAAGGGVHNRQLMAQLAAFIPAATLRTTDEFGIDADAKEAIAFAVLAHRTWRGKTGNLPSATGASHAVVLGSITPGG